MLTRLLVRNFKRLHEAEIELGDTVVFIGPNNSGKTSALQALALWQTGVSRWNEKRGGAKAPACAAEAASSRRRPEKRPGVTVNRRDLVALPVPAANLLWRDLHVREVERALDGKTKKTRNILIEVVVEGITDDKQWKCGLEFDYANEESFYCRPLRTGPDASARMSVPPEACQVKVAFLPPMSGLASNETLLQPGAVNVLVGEGKTAEVLRNLCYAICQRDDGRAGWSKILQHVNALFGVELEPPVYVPERGEIGMRYREKGVTLDLSSSGRGLQQTLLLLAYMYANPGSVLLLDEPDAHLEILRQRQTYQLLVDVARENGNQIVAASHSEVLLNEAAGRDVVVAFLGRPHRIDNRGSQLAKALKDIPFQDYYQAEQTGWVLYLEGSTDLAMLRAFAERLGHAEASAALGRPFVRYVGNQPNEVRKHFHGLREAVQRLEGIAVFDRLEGGVPENLGAEGLTWRRCEIENYVCCPESLEAYARQSGAEDSPGPLFTAKMEESRVQAMRESVGEIEDALRTLGEASPWSPDLKVSDKFLTRLFERYFGKLGLPNIMAKKNFHELARFVPLEKLDPEIKQKLDAVAAVARSARPAGEIA